MLDANQENGLLGEAYHTARRVAVAIIGGTLIVAGILMIFLPGPALVVIPAGLGVLGIEFAWARRWLRRLRDEAKRGAGLFSSSGRTESSRRGPRA